MGLVFASFAGGRNEVCADTFVGALRTEAETEAQTCDYLTWGQSISPQDETMTFEIVSDCLSL